MKLFEFLGDLVNQPEAAVETMKEQRNIWKSVLLFVGTGMIILTNYFLSHFTGGFPKIVLFTFILAVVGIIAEFGFVMGFVVDTYILFKLTKYKPAGDTVKTLSWCVLVPSLIFHLGLFLLNLFLISIDRIEWIGYLYDTLRWLLYIWITGLSVVTVHQHQPEHKIRNMIGVLGTFALNWAIWVTLHWMLMQGLFTTLI